MERRYDKMKEQEKKQLLARIEESVLWVVGNIIYGNPPKIMLFKYFPIDTMTFRIIILVGDSKKNLLEIDCDLEKKYHDKALSMYAFYNRETAGGRDGLNEWRILNTAIVRPLSECGFELQALRSLTIKEKVTNMSTDIIAWESDRGKNYYKNKDVFIIISEIVYKAIAEFEAKMENRKELES